MNPNGVRVVLPMLFDSMNQKQKWQVKVGALQQLGALTKTAPAPMKAALPDIVPAVTGCFADAKPQVKVGCFKVSCELLMLQLNITGSIGGGGAGEGVRWCAIVRQFSYITTCMYLKYLNA